MKKRNPRKPGALLLALVLSLSLVLPVSAAESGKAALGHMLDRLALEYPKKPIYLSVIPGNDAAVRLYRGAGFRFTGEKDVHGEDVMRLAYSERNS